MQNELSIKQNKEILQQSNQLYLTIYDLQEKNWQFQLLNEQLLKDKEKAAILRIDYFVGNHHLRLI